MEAKVGPFIFSARSNATGMREPGFNSAINGQLALKYRFAKALERGEPATARASMPELRNLLRCWGNTSVNSRDPRSLPRRLFKPEIVANTLIHDALLGHPEGQCCYVALTWDTTDRAFFRVQGG